MSVYKIMIDKSTSKAQSIKFRGLDVVRDHAIFVSTDEADFSESMPKGLFAQARPEGEVLPQFDLYGDEIVIHDLDGASA